MIRGEEALVSNEPSIRLLRVGDFPAAMRLKEAEGWNQTEDDWRLLLDLSPEGCFVLERAGEVIATSTAVPYVGPFGWVGMMLVRGDERRRGHGARMLEQAVSSLEGKGLVAALDATPSGKALYDRHGFVDLCGIERCVGTAPGGRRRGPPCRDLSEDSLEEVLALDRECFGADRSDLLRGLLRREAGRGLAWRAAGEIEGFLLGRPGARSFHLGPWVARTPEAAAGLLDAALSVLPGLRVGVDVPVPNGTARRLAAAAGLETVRTLVRMVRPRPGRLRGEGPPAPAVPPGGRTDRVFGLAGLELG